MKLIDTIHLSLETFRNRKSRTFLTVLGVGVGIGAVLFLVSLGYGMQKILLERITTAESFLTLDIASPDPSVIKLNEQTLEEIERVSGVEKVSPQAMFSGQISSDGLTSEAIINLVNPDYFSLNGVLPQTGGIFSEHKANEIVVNSKVAELFDSTVEKILNKEIELLVFIPDEDSDGTASFEIDRAFKVIGVVEGSEGAGEIFIFRLSLPEVPVTEFQFVKAKVAAEENLEAVRDHLINSGFMVSAISDVIDQANKIFRGVQIILGIFGIVAVVVAAISLANTMTISLLERTQEIGVMRAIGASRRDIKYLFLIESTLIGVLGGLIGILMGWIGAVVVNLGIMILAKNLGGQPVNLFHTPLWFLMFIMIFSTSVGFLTGIFPARRASRLNPLMALRYK
jgi:putative ABC transport system permease protein